jgi:hypothetical protein
MARYTQFKVWLDGKIVDPEEATLSVCSRSRPGTGSLGARKLAVLP